VLFVLLVPSYYDAFKEHVRNLSIYLHLSNKVETPSILTPNYIMLSIKVRQSWKMEHVASIVSCCTSLIPSISFVARRKGGLPSASSAHVAA